MPSFINADPYKRYQAVKLIFQSSLSAKVVVKRRDNPEERYLMVVAPTKIKYDQGVKIKNDIMDQVEKLLELSHPNLVNVFEAYHFNGYCYWVMEDWCSKRETHGFGLKHLTEARVAILVKDLISVIRYLHRNDVVHGNLCFDNIKFIESTDPERSLNFQIVDLGMGRHVDKIKYVKTLQSRALRYGNAPEVLDGEFTKAGDVWSIGAVAFRLLTGDISPIPLSERMEQFEETLESSASISLESKDFVRDCLVINPQDRINCEVILEHPWFARMATVNGGGVILNSSILENLNRVHENIKFKEIASQIVADFVDKKELEEFREMFTGMDTDGTGNISHDKFVKALTGYIPEDRLTDLFLLIDKDGTGRIAYDEFVGVVLQCKEDIAEQQLIQAFHNMDKNSDGVISVEDLTNVMDIDEEEAREIMYGVISNEIADPKVDLHMFLQLFHGKKTKWSCNMVQLRLCGDK